MKTLIDTYQIPTGEHCGSVAMGGLLRHYCRLDLPEPAVFGLGAGIDCLYLESSDMQPAISVFGRTATMEVEVGEILDVDYRERPENDERAWEVVRDEVLAGRPTMLSGDIFYLDYRDYKVHFPGHRFVLLGFDDTLEKAYLADRVRHEPELCSYRALALSRNPPEGLSTHNLWGRFHGTDVGRSLRDAAALAIERATRRMLGEDDVEREEAVFSGTSSQRVRGLAGIHYFADELPRWANRPDAMAVAGFNASCLEKFGNGGGNFRRLYAGFLDWAHALDPSLVPESAGELARQAAAGWTAASLCLYRVTKEGPRPELFDAAARHIAEVATVERQLFEGLAAR